MLSGPWVALAAVLALGGAYAGGRYDGGRIADAAELKAERKAGEVREQLQGEIDASGERHATAELGRRDQVRELIRETQTVVDRPVYRNVCVDADGVRLLDRAAEIANGEPAPAGDAAAAAAVPAH